MGQSDPVNISAEIIPLPKFGAKIKIHINEYISFLFCCFFNHILRPLGDIFEESGTQRIVSHRYVFYVYPSLYYAECAIPCYSEFHSIYGGDYGTFSLCTYAAQSQ